jgi:DNA polymerase-3 subunit chi
MTELLFYHLQDRPLDAVLPGLLERSLERGWRVVVQTGSAERMRALDDHLWSYRDGSFLPHGLAREPDASRQPVCLTDDPGNPNGATVRFLVDGAPLPLDQADDYERLVLMFDGNDPDGLAAARAEWARAKAAGLAGTYWQMNEAGRWERKS